MDFDKTETNNNSDSTLYFFISKKQFEQKANFMSFLSTKKALVLVVFGMYEFVSHSSSGNEIKHLIFSVLPFVLLFILYNKSRIKQRDVIQANKTNPSLINQLYSKANKYVYKKRK